MGKSLLLIITALFPLILQVRANSADKAHINGMKHAATNMAVKWHYDIGISLFKSSVNNQPDEILYNRVFEKWEGINTQSDLYTVTRYKPLNSFAFVLVAGVDIMLRYKRYLMIKVGYNFSSSLGIGGSGSIQYTEIVSNRQIFESKEMSFDAHQLTCFIGPLVPIKDQGAQIFMGFSMMSPTFITFNEKFTREVNSVVTRTYDRNFKGFFGNCRALIGIQVPVSDRLRLGTELIFAYFNGLTIQSGDLKDQGFKFPPMHWNFTLRYQVR